MHCLVMGQLCSGGAAPETATITLATGTASNNVGGSGNSSTSGSMPVGDVVGIELSLGANTAGSGGACNQNQCGHLGFNIGGISWTPYFGVSSNGSCGGESTGGLVDLDLLGLVFSSSGTLNIEAFDSAPQNCVDQIFTDLSVTVYICPTGEVLPIVLKEFFVKSKGHLNEITWITEKEINNQFQIIEKSDNGESSWTELGRVIGRENSSAEATYSMIDANPFETSYYRIKSIDYDGLIKYSHIINITREEGQNPFITINPNPGLGLFNINVSNFDSGFLTFKIYDYSGNLIKLTHQPNEIEWNNIILDLTDKPNGLYFIHIQTENGIVMKKLMKI